MAKRLQLGKSFANADGFVALVTGGGRHGPGELFRIDLDCHKLAIVADNRSNSRKSGSVVFDTRKPGLYQYVGVATGNQRCSSGYFEYTADGEFIQLTDQQFQDRRLALYPNYAAMIEAEGIRRQQDIAWANEYQQRELDFRREIMERQQEEHDRRLLISNLPELPKLTGTAKQIKWAKEIRAAYATRSPGSPHLTGRTTAKWWIDHRYGFTEMALFPSELQQQIRKIRG